MSKLILVSDVFVDIIAYVKVRKQDFTNRLFKKCITPLKYISDPLNKEYGIRNLHLLEIVKALAPTFQDPCVWTITCITLRHVNDNQWLHNCNGYQKPTV